MSKDTQNKQKSPYQVMTSILTNYNPTHEEKLSMNSFFACRYLSNNPMSIFLANAYNRYSVIPVDIQYDVAKQLLRGKIKFIQFPKKSKDTNDVLANISRFYKVSEDVALEYYNLMTDEVKEEFRDLYKGA